MNIFQNLLLKFRVSNYRYHKHEYHIWVVRPRNQFGCWVPGEYFIRYHDYNKAREKLKQSLTLRK